MKKLLLILALSALLPTAAFADASTYLNFTAVNGPATIALDSVGTPNEINLLYSTDNCSTWNTYTIGNTISLASGAKVYFKALNTNGAFAIGDTTSYWPQIVSYYNYKMTGTVAADGNIMSLLNESMSSTSLPKYAFAYLFDGCSSLTTAPELPATILADSCYSRMFQGCSSLTSAPALPATTLAVECYSWMFSGCNSLLSAPALPATTMADQCYYSMFYACRSLLSAPALPATTLAPSCYNAMFADCTSLTQIPDLPADSLPSHCYNIMFRGCSSIIVNLEDPGKEWSIEASYVGHQSMNNMFYLTGGTMSGTPSANTTYYLPAYVEDVDTSSADAYFYCTTTFDSVPVARFHFTMYRTGGSDTVDIYFANDTSFVINRLPRTVQIIDSVTGNTTTVTITINQAASSPDCNEVNVHLENLAPNSTYYLTLTPLDASDNVLDSYSSGFVTPEADSPTPTALEDCHTDIQGLFFPSDNTDVYAIDGRYLGKYHDSLPPAIYIMWENGKAHKFAKTR